MSYDKQNSLMKKLFNDTQVVVSKVVHAMRTSVVAFLQRLG